MAQETDWMDKLEKRLRRSPKMAADAEEISEELDVRVIVIITYYLHEMRSIIIGHCSNVGFGKLYEETPRIEVKTYPGYWSLFNGRRYNVR